MKTKYSLLAIVVAVSCLGASAANAAEVYNNNGTKVDVYGLMDGVHYSSKDKSNDGDKSYARLGIKAESQINDQLTGYGQYETQFGLNNTEANGNGFKTRVGFAGLKYGNLGSLDFGRNYGAIYDIGSYTDVMYEFGGDNNAEDNFMSRRTNDVLTYRNSDFFGLIDGLNLTLQYQGENNGANDSEGIGGNIAAENGNGYSGAVTYTVPDTVISFGTGFMRSNRTHDQINQYAGSQYQNSAKTAQAWNVGARYNGDKLYLATIYAETENMKNLSGNTDPTDNTLYNWTPGKTQNFEAAAFYQFDNGIRPGISYYQQRSRFDANGNSNNGTWINSTKYVDVSTEYVFNKNVSAYVEYKYNLLNKNGANASMVNTNKDNILATGILYQF